MYVFGQINKLSFYDQVDGLIHVLFPLIWLYEPRLGGQREVFPHPGDNDNLSITCRIFTINLLLDIDSD